MSTTAPSNIASPLINTEQVSSPLSSQQDDRQYQQQSGRMRQEQNQKHTRNTGSDSQTHRPQSRHNDLESQQEQQDLQSQSQSITAHIHRPIPTLFKNPPSRNSSQVSLPLPQSSNSTTTSGTTSQGRRSQRPTHTFSPSISERPDFETNLPPATFKTTAHDAAWAQLTLKLHDIDHHASQPFLDQPMSELRASQVELAHAWRRTKEEGGAGGGVDHDNEHEERSPTAAAAAKGIMGEEEEKERELLLAKKRREANDKHFEKAKKNINDVLMKLERTAQAMNKVEEATREIWVRAGHDDPALETGEDEANTVSA